MELSTDRIIKWIRMPQKKTIFERLEDKMIELQQNFGAKLTTLQESVEKLKQEIPQSIGQNLMHFSDIIGGKIENIEDAFKNISGSGTPIPDISVIKSIQNELNDIKAGINNLQNAVQNIKIEIPPVSTPITATPPHTTSTITPRISATPYIASTSQTPSSVPPTHLTSAPTSTSVKVTPQSAFPSEGTVTDVLNLLETIKNKARSGISGIQLAGVMEQIRDMIVKVFRWHPALYELATFARRLKKYPEGTAPDSEILSLLLNKVDEWKNRISG